MNWYFEIDSMDEKDIKMLLKEYKIRFEKNEVVFGKYMVGRLEFKVRFFIDQQISQPTEQIKNPKLYLLMNKFPHFLDQINLENEFLWKFHVY